MSALPIDLLVHVISPFFLFCAEEGEDKAGANAGYRLLQLCGLTAQQKKQMTDNMTHPVFEFERDVKRIASNGFPGFARVLMEHAIRPCRRLIHATTTTNEPPPRPLVIDTGSERGRDYLLMALLASVLRHTRRVPFNAIVYGIDGYARDWMNECMLKNVDPVDVQRVNNEKIVLSRDRTVRFRSCLPSSSLTVYGEGHVDLIIVNGCSRMSEPSLDRILCKAYGTPSIILIGQTDSLDNFLRKLRLRNPDMPYDLARVAPPLAQ